MGRILLGVLLMVAMAPALARECGEGRVSGGFSATGDALQNYECALVARIYCRVAEDRDAGLPEDDATRRTLEWLQRMNSTGSHRKGNWQPVVKIAAADVFRPPQRQPGPSYYRAGYSCGVAKRVSADAAAQRKATTAFEAAADTCERQHPAPGKRSYPNTALRDCLAAAVDRLAPATQAQK